MKEVGEGSSTTLSKLMEWKLSQTQNFGIIMYLNGSRARLVSLSSSSVLTNTRNTRDEKRSWRLVLGNFKAFQGILLALLSKATYNRSFVRYHTGGGVDRAGRQPAGSGAVGVRASHSGTPRHSAREEPGIEPATFRLPADPHS